jgi:hypothetical protein
MSGDETVSCMFRGLPLLFSFFSLFSRAEAGFVSFLCLEG